MKWLVAVLMMFCAAGRIGFGQESSDDPYSEKLVTVLAKRSTPVISMQEKAVNRLGDRAAIGLVRHLGVQTPATQQEIEGILFVIKMAFAAPQIINSDADREPKATLLLLSYLGQLPASLKSKEEIQRTRTYVEQQIREYNLQHAKEKQ